MKFTAVDLFAGCGGLSEGMKQAGFTVIAAVEIEKNAADTYRLNHPETVLFEENIRNVNTKKIKELLNNQPLHLLAGCPPCQGFSSIRRKNRITPVEDKRNDLIIEWYRFVKELKPLTIMMENVSGLIHYELFKTVLQKLKKNGYHLNYNIVNIAHYGIPQRRKRLVLVGSLLGELNIAQPNNIKKTVRDTIGNLELPEKSTDILHKIFPEHSQRIKEMITLLPKDGGSREDLPKRFALDCHKKINSGFNDIYGRLRWDDYSSTITGGCLNPSKGRFLHPEQNRCISFREASLLQTFPKSYIFKAEAGITALSLLIGNALPPEFSKIQNINIHNHLMKNLYD